MKVLLRLTQITLLLGIYALPYLNAASSSASVAESVPITLDEAITNEASRSPFFAQPSIGDKAAIFDRLASSDEPTSRAFAIAAIDNGWVTSEVL
jgi:hypothetical protein